MGGSLKFSEILSATESYPVYRSIKNFIETGTYKGETAIMASSNYKTVYTIEISEERYQESKDTARLNNISNVIFYLGDSTYLLKEIIPLVLEGSIFFLDAHISGFDTKWNQQQRVPLLEELNIILSYKIGPSVFILDDVRFWKGNNNQVWDWEHIDSDTIINLFLKHGYKIVSCFEQNDRFYVLTG